MTQRNPRTTSAGERRAYKYPGRTTPAPTAQAQEGTRTSSAGSRTTSAGSTRTSSAGSRTSSAQSTRTSSAGANRAIKMGGKKPKKKKKSNAGLIAAIVIVALLLIGAVILIVRMTGTKNAEQAAIDEALAQKMSLPVPEAPKVESTSTIGATGDILTHNSVLAGALSADGSYDFSGSFDAISEYWSAVDYMIANLEVTCGGEEAGEYTGYPTFNAPDSIVTGLKNAGVDMLLTANNHSYDTGEYGFLRTQEVADKAGLEHIGTRESENDSYVKVIDVNGIKFGMTCYTYDTREYTQYEKSLNLNVMTDATENLVNSFTYEDLDSLYTSCNEALQEMWDQGADITIFFLHFGTEYMDEPNEEQEEICHALSEMGVNVIIGGHPHVIQKYETITNSAGDETYCLYSMGNALSSQRKEVMVPEEPRGYTEDGLTFEITYEKLNNGRIRLKEIYILPTWVDITGNGVYRIVPLDHKKDSASWDTYNTWEATESYDRTIGRLGEGYAAIRSELGNEAVPEDID